MKQFLAQELFNLILEINKLSSSLILLVFLVVTLVIVLDSLFTHSKNKAKLTGLADSSKPIGVDGLKSFPSKTYVSEIQGLAGRPDALVRENGFIIPVERKPLAKKIRDRYIAQLLVYMRLVEEFEGRKPPYGYLILGANCKRVKIYNTEEKQAWLSNLLLEMKSVLEGSLAKAFPDKQKCKKCSVKTFCTFKPMPQQTDKLPLARIKIIH